MIGSAAGMASLEARVCLLFTPELCRGDPWDTLQAALAGGVGLVQWRVKTDPRAGLERCLALCRARGVPVIVNDAVALAVEFDAAGAHVGQDDLPAGRARQLLGNRWLGVSTHDHAQIDAAIAAGADYVGFGPCFPTATKGYTAGQGVAAAAAAVRHARVPVFAIGGIDAPRAAQLARAGVRHIAVSSAILQASDPRAAAAALVHSISIASPNE